MKGCSGFIARAASSAFVGSELSFLGFYLGCQHADVRREGRFDQQGAIIVRSEQRLHILDGQGNDLQSFGLPDTLRKDRQIACVPLSNGQALVWNVDADANLYWLDAQHMVRHQQVALPRGKGRSLLREATEAFSFVPMPALVVLLTALTPLEDRPQAAPGSYGAKLASTAADLWPVLLAAVLLALVLAWLVVRGQRRYGLRWTPVWVTLVAVFGLPVYSGPGDERWPARLPCPHCGQRVPRDRPACLACHQDFPAPQLKGIEIFA